MTRAFWWIAALVLQGGFLIAVVVLVGRRLKALAPDPIDDLIKPPRQVFEGADEALARRTRQRRKLAADMKADALKVETRDDSRSKIQLVAK